MKRKTIDLDKLKRKGVVLAAIPVMLLGLTGCNKGNPNTKEVVISEETSEIPIINTTSTTESTASTTTTATSTSTGVTSSTSSTSTTKTTTATTTTKETATTTTSVEYAHELLKDEVYEELMSMDLTKKSLSELLTIYTKDMTPEQATQICSIVLTEANYEGRVGAARTTDVQAAIITSNCVSPKLAEVIKDSLLCSNVDKIDELNLNEELKQYYTYMNNLYVAYLNAADARDAYLMTINGVKIYNAISEIDELLLKNKITDEQRLNYFVSYENDEMKESNLVLGESYLKNYFEFMREYVTEENYAEYCDWTSTNYAIQNTFTMLEEDFAVEKFDDKYIAIKIEEKAKTKVVK